MDPSARGVGNRQSSLSSLGYGTAAGSLFRYGHLPKSAILSPSPRRPCLPNDAE